MKSQLQGPEATTRMDEIMSSFTVNKIGPDSKHAKKERQYQP